jgi:hypothetical protein
VRVAVHDAKFLRPNFGCVLLFNGVQVFGQPGTFVFAEIGRVSDSISHARQWVKIRKAEITRWRETVEFAQQGTDVAECAASVGWQLAPKGYSLTID